MIAKGNDKKEWVEGTTREMDSGGGIQNSSRSSSKHPGDGR